MSPATLRWLPSGMLLLLGVFAQARAQQPGPVDPAAPRVDAAAAKAALAKLELDGGVEAAVKDAVRPDFQRAVALLEEARDFGDRAAVLSAAVERAPVELDAVRGELASLPTADRAEISIPAAAPVEELQKDLDARRLALVKLRAELAAAGSESRRLSGRPGEISARLPDAQRELKAARAEWLATGALPDKASPGQIAKQLLLEAAVANLGGEVAMLEAERVGLAGTAKLAEARRDLLARKVALAAGESEALKAEIAGRLTREAQRVRAIAEADAGELEGAGPAVRALADEVRQLAADFERVVEDIKSVSAAQAGAQAEVTELNRRYEVVSGQIEFGDSGRAMAQVVLDLRRRLPGRRVLKHRLGDLEEQLDSAQLSAFLIEGKIREQGDLEKKFGGGGEGPAARLLSTRADLLAKLDRQYGNLVGARAALIADGRRYADRVAEVEQLLEESFFWMRSSPPIGAQTGAGLPAALSWLATGDFWGEVAGRWLARAGESWPLNALAAAALVALAATRRRTVRALVATGVETRRISTDCYTHTAKAMACTILLAVPVPIVLWHSGWLLWRDTSPEGRPQLFGLALLAGGWMAFALRSLAEACREGGIAEAHFGSPPAVLRRLRRASLAFLLAYVPSLLVAITTFYADDPGHFDSLGRLVFIASHLFWALLLWRLFHPERGVVGPRGDDGEHLLVRWAKLWHPLLSLCPVALVFSAAAGYVITAFNLSLQLFTTLAVIGTGVLAYRLALRWFLIKERKLALAMALEERAARREAARAEALAESGEEQDAAPADEEVVREEELDLESIGGQTRRLLAFFFMVGTMLAVALLWSRTVPFLEPLADIRPAFGLSLLDIGKIALVIGFSVILIKNLPGLLELAMLRHTSIAPGTRYAVATLCRYAVTAIAIAVVLDALSIDWSQLGWIAAALGVGIGFGLQEVVANFICGLILLFERPVRVGDVITIEGITGRVTRIRIRATEITDWDRKEFVVPNKALVTGTLLNWTLNNSVNRAVINVGVAYGSDTGRAREILCEIGADHPLVLDDPPPVASFEAFGESSLDLSLRAYLPDMENRLRTITELHAEIDAASPRPESRSRSRSATCISAAAGPPGRGAVRATPFRGLALAVSAAWCIVCAMSSPLPLLPDPDLEEYGDRIARSMERYAKRLRPGELRALFDTPTVSVLQEMRAGIGADSVGVWSADEGRENLVASVAEPVDERFLGRQQPLSEGFISLVFASEQPICENRVAEDARHSKRIDSIVGHTTEAMIAVPFYLGGVLKGVVSAVRWGEGPTSGASFRTGDLRSVQRGAVVVERLVNLGLARVILGLEL